MWPSSLLQLPPPPLPRVGGANRAAAGNRPHFTRCPLASSWGVILVFCLPWLQACFPPGRPLPGSIFRRLHLPDQHLSGPTPAVQLERKVLSQDGWSAGGGSGGGGVLPSCLLEQMRLGDEVTFSSETFTTSFPPNSPSRGVG